MDTTAFVVSPSSRRNRTLLQSQGSGTLDAGYTWELYLNGTKVQDNTNPGGWTISIVGPPVDITPPTTLTSTVGYKLVWYWNYSTFQAQFDALPVATVRQGMNAMVSPSGSDAPASGLTWDIVQAGATVASSAVPNSWSVVFDYPNISVTCPITAGIASNYEVRMQISTSTPPYYADISKTFSVAIGHVIMGAGTKTAMLTDRSESFIYRALGALLIHPKCALFVRAWNPFRRLLALRRQQSVWRLQTSVQGSLLYDS